MTITPTNEDADELPLTYSWDEGGPPAVLTREEAEMVLLFEIADALKMPAYQQK